MVFDWKLKTSRTEPHPYLLIMMDDNGGFWKHGHERYATKQEALARATYLTDKENRRVDVVRDVAASENWSSDGI